MSEIYVENVSLEGQNFKLKTPMHDEDIISNVEYEA